MSKSKKSKSCNTIEKRDKMNHAPEDRISMLPEDILYHILSFLDMREVLQTTFLSRRWRHTWKYVRDLNFDYSLWKQLGKKMNNVRPYALKTSNKGLCVTFVERIIYTIYKSTDIRKFNMTRTYCPEASRLDTWLSIPLKHTKEVYLDITIAKQYTLPYCLCDSEIEVFKIKARCVHDKSVQLPNSICSVHQLRILDLEEVRLPEGNSNRELHMSYPVLESLRLKGCNRAHIEILNISAPQLKKLVIKDSRVLRDKCLTKICSPCLMFLQLCDHGDYLFGNLSSLATAEISSSSDWISEANWLIRNLGSLHNVSTLKLVGLDKASPECMPMMDQLLKQFSNLRCLELLRVSVQLAAIYLRSAPCVETLILQMGSSLEGKDKDLKKELSRKHRFNHLKFVRLKYTECHDNELQLLAFLLETAVVLEKVAVTRSMSDWKEVQEKNKLAEFKMKLNSLPKASSKVKIRVLLDSARCKF